jgi:hypothetical protein
MAFEGHELLLNQTELEFATLKIPVVLYAFHALQYPEQHPDKEIKTAESTGSPYVEIGEAFDWPEHVVKDPYLPVAAKAEWLCLQFSPIARLLLSKLELQPAIAMTSEVMQAGLENLGDSDTLTDDQSNPMLASGIMPPNRVIRAMLQAGSGEYGLLKRCRPLETFIERVFRPDPEYPRIADASSALT